MCIRDSLWDGARCSAAFKSEISELIEGQNFCGESTSEIVALKANDSNIFTSALASSPLTLGASREVGLLARKATVGSAAKGILKEN